MLRVPGSCGDAGSWQGFGRVTLRDRTKSLSASAPSSLRHKAGRGRPETYLSSILGELKVNLCDGIGILRPRKKVEVSDSTTKEIGGREGIISAVRCRVHQRPGD